METVSCKTHLWLGSQIVTLQMRLAYNLVKVSVINSSLEISMLKTV